ncbi:MAG: DNA repair protein RecO [Anaerolineales bacterium]|nr:DNA repair protein RecO [Anaerolineales bacterium]
MPERERLYRAEGIVLSRKDFGEADRLLTVFTREYGKLKQIAKGVRRPKSRKAGHLELFTRVQLLAARGRELDVITQVEAIETYPQLSKNLQLVGQASYILELVKHFAVQGEVNRELYRLLVETLGRLNSGDPSSKVTRYFELRLLELAGYRPELFRCGHCQLEIRPEAQFFSYIDGGVLCPNCGREQKGVRPITLAALKVMRHYQRNPFSIASTARIQIKVHQELDHLMEGFFIYLTEHKLNSPRFLRRINQNSVITLEEDKIA